MGEIDDAHDTERQAHAHGENAVDAADEYAAQYRLQRQDERALETSHADHPLVAAKSRSALW